MSEFISGDDAKLAWAKGEKVQWRQSFDWNDLGGMNILGIFDDEDIEFRLKPRTITLNGVEVPAPFEPKKGMMVWSLNSFEVCQYESWVLQKNLDGRLVWKNEEEIKQVVAALRSVFGKK